MWGSVSSTHNPLTWCWNRLRNAPPKRRTRKKPPPPPAAGQVRGRTSTRIPEPPPDAPAYPPISDYALIGDCHTAALVSRAGSIDWCCLPRFDSDSCFGRLLDWEKGGQFVVTPHGRAQVAREYLKDTLVLVTTYKSGRNLARVIDFFSMKSGGR